MNRKLMTIILVLTLTITLVSGCGTPNVSIAPSTTTAPTTATSTTPAEVEAGAVVDEVKLGSGNTVFIYTPVSDLMGSRPTSTPVLIVFGNENYTLGTAKTTAENSSLADLAAKEGCVIVFVNSISGTWAEADTKSYLALNAVISDSSDTGYVNGKTEEAPFRYAGSRERYYIYADGAGADFVAKYNLFGPALTTRGEFTPASVTLFNLSSLPAFAAQAVDIPVVTVNGPAGIENKLKIASPSGVYKMETSTAKTGFDSSIIAADYAEIAGAYRREMGVLIKVPDYPALGITETIRTETISTGEIEYYEYIPDNLDMTKAASVPLVMIFHGGGSHAEYYAWATEWPLIGKDNGFMVVSVNKHVDRSSDEIVELLQILETKYPAIDKTRIYACGFSMGGVKSWNIGMRHSDQFAGVIPCDAGYMADGSASDENGANIMPLFYVAGGVSMLSERPHQDGQKANNVDQMLATYFKMNKVNEAYVFDAASGVWGLKADSTKTVPDPVFVDNTAEISYYKSADGNIYTALCLDTNKAHMVYASDSYIAWEFIRQFSRNSDGTIKISK